jgi:hypothetical protein
MRWPRPTDRALDEGFEVLPYARFQAQTTDWLAVAARRHAFHVLLEVDVSRARAAIRAHRARTGERLSFTAYIVGCLARAVAEDRRVQAMRHGRRGLIVFHDVDVVVPVQRDLEGDEIPVPHVVRAADTKDLSRITLEISGAVQSPVPFALGRRLLRLWLIVPAVARRALLAAYLSDAHRRRRATGTILVSAVTTPGHGMAWGIPSGTNYPITLLIGSLRRPARQAGQVEGPGGQGESVALTLTFDHDTLNGGPAARFVRRFARLVESGELVDEGRHSQAASSVDRPHS